MTGAAQQALEQAIAACWITPVERVTTGSVNGPGDLRTATVVVACVPITEWHRLVAAVSAGVADRETPA